jgi:hypothetical protein
MFTTRMEKLLLCVSEQRATAACWRGGRIVHMEHFARSDLGLAAFRDFLAPHPGTPVFMLVDAAAEDYRIEALPHCSGAERRQMVARKLKQHYRNTPYTAACLQDREPTGRRDDRYLFCALTDAELADRWIGIIRAQALLLAGVYLLPMISAALPGGLRVPGTNILIASAHADSLRLTFLRDRHVRMSRVMRADAAQGADVTRLFLSEISNTRLYLHALRSATLDEPLTVLLIDRNDELEHVAAAIVHESPAVECVRAGHADLCTKLRIEPRHLAFSPDSVHLHLLGLGPRAESIAPAAATRRHERHRTRKKIYATCAAITSVAAVWSAVNGWTAYETRAQADEVTRRIANEDAQYQRIAAQFPRSPASGEAMKRTVELSKTLRENAREPLPMMAAISQALQPSPDIVLREFGWTYSGTDIQKGPDAAVPSAAATPTAASPPARKQSAYLLGEIRPFGGDYRAAIASIEALADRLRRNPHVAEVRTTRMPLDVRPNAILSGTTLESRAQAGSAEFEILIVYEPRV